MVGAIGAATFALVVTVLTAVHWSFLRERGWDLIKASDIPFPSILALSPASWVQIVNFATRPCSKRWGVRSAGRARDGSCAGSRARSWWASVPALPSSARRQPVVGPRDRQLFGSGLAVLPDLPMSSWRIPIYG